MAKGILNKVMGWFKKPKKKRPGVHSKKRRSVNKQGKHWKKPYRGQGR